MLEIVILAAGKGTRMRSDHPKVMHLLAGKPFLEHVLDCAETLKPQKIHVVVGHGAEQVKQYFCHQDLNFVHQTEQLGTGHAVQQAMPSVSPESTVLILYGDVPLISHDTLAHLVSQVSSDSMALLTVQLDNPQGYGRILRDDKGSAIGIVEQKDATKEQLTIDEVNTGVMAVPAVLLNEWLPTLKNTNVQGEYYLTDIVALASEQNIAVNTASAASESEVLGVNNRMQQAQLERCYQMSVAQSLMESGATLMDPNRLDVRGDLTVGKDCVIDINCVFEGQVKLGDNVSIGPNCIIQNSSIGDGCDIKANSIIEDSQLQNNCSVGPFARLRPGTILERQAKIGNFVETKKAHIGEGSKVNHLSYVGDAIIGKAVNIGAGTITCNYDGVNKSLTEIEDNVFIGSNTALVAPVKISKDATIGAGSTITKSVADKQLAVARQRQINIDGWQRPVKK